MNIKMVVAIAVIALLGIIGFSSYNSPQSEESIVATKQDIAKLNDVAKRWGYKSEAVSKSSRTEMPVIVKDMQSLRDETDNLKVTSCLTGAQENLLIAMDSEITGYLKLISDTDASLTTDMKKVYKAIEKYNEIVEDCTV